MADRVIFSSSEAREVQRMSRSRTTGAADSDSLHITGMSNDRQQKNSSLAIQWTRPEGSLTVPVLLLVFNRPDQTSNVFEAIREIQPERLYVAADGPRPHRPEEAKKCEEVRRIVATVDWPCEVKTLYRPVNLGCKRGVSSAITWFFDNEPEGIILEDDCLPSPSFFWFCQELLARFRDDERVWQVCGTAMLDSSLYDRAEDSYIFSRYGPIWGWASWRRAWAHYDADLIDWLHMRRPYLFNSLFRTSRERNFVLDVVTELRDRQLSAWAYQWELIRLYQSGLSIIPCVNMVVNIGFGPDATHTLRSDRSAPSSKADLWPPITHPRYVVVNELHDLLYRDKVLLACNSRRERAKRALRKVAKSVIRIFRRFSSVPR